MPTTKLQSEGQVAIPHEIRQRLGLRTGALLRIELAADDTIRLVPEAPRARTSKPSSSRLPGLLRHLTPERPVSVEEMNEAVVEVAVERFRKATAR